MPSACQIIAEQLCVEFPRQPPVLEEFNLTCPAGQFVALIGPSGCGKSTFLRCVAGLQSLTSGRLQCQTDKGAKPRIAYVFQDPTLLPWRRVWQNVALPLELEGQSLSARRQLALDGLRWSGFRTADADKLPHMLSGGMRMRASIARALVTRPDILLLDEPFAALDDISRHQLNDELLRLWNEQHWTVIFVTRNVAEAVFLSQRVLVMTQRPGRIVSDQEIKFPMPREPELRSTIEFSELTGRIAAQLAKAAA